MSDDYPEDSPLEQDGQDEEDRSYDPDERRARSFLILLGIIAAIVLLSILLSLSIDNLTKIWLLLGLLMLAMVVVLIFERRYSSGSMLTSGSQSANPNAEDELSGLQENGTIEYVQTEDDLDGAATQTPFEHLVREALDSIPTEFHAQMENLAVVVESEPDEETLQRVGVEEGYTLLGLYQGVPLTTYGYHSAPLPEHITIYQHTIERLCGGDPERIRARVRATVLHEVAHHFGIAHEEMPIWVK
jgi:predicted Zn-dependent protease with MMP-like domain